MQPKDPVRQTVRDLVEEEVRKVQTREDAAALLKRLREMAGDRTVADAGNAAATTQGEVPTQVIRRSTTGPSTIDDAAKLITTTAKEAVAPVPEAESVAAGAQDALKPAGPAAPDVETGKRMLEQAALEEMDPFERVDARAFLAINYLPHPPAADAAANAITFWTTGGWIWSVALAIAWALRVPRAREALRITLPTVACATFVIENIIKRLFRRQRPFITIVRALVVGRKPGSWSFPSGHTAAAFAGAWTISSIFPRKAPIFFGLASFVGFSRVFAGAHYPGDVISGAAFGGALAEGFRRLFEKLIDP